MVPFHAPLGTGELLARVSFLEPLVAGRRVLEVGAVAATGGATAHALAERGAAEVVALDPDAAAVERAGRERPHARVAFRAGDVGSPGATAPASFDLVLVHDGAALAAAPDRVAALAALLAPGGRLAAALPVPGAPALARLAGLAGADEAPGYDAFVGSLQAVFPAVEIATQTAAVGWVVAATGDAAPELAVDGAWSGEPDAAAYLAVCGDGPSGLAGMVLVTLPVAPLLEAREARERDDRARAGERHEAIERAITEARAETAAAIARAEEATLRADRAAPELARLEAEIAEARAALARASAERDAAVARTRELEAALAALRTAEAERARERDEARREAAARIREARAWSDAQVRLEQRIAELEILVRSQAAAAETAQRAAASAIADAERLRAALDAARAAARSDR
jgi:SAM-dependent methyltransferase